jgi:hypothetical protein
VNEQGEVQIVEREKKKKISKVRRAKLAYEKMKEEQSRQGEEGGF